MAVIRELITILRFKSETGAVRNANRALSSYQQKVRTTERNTGRSFVAMGKSATRAFATVGVAVGGALVSGIFESLNRAKIETQLRSSLSGVAEEEFVAMRVASERLSKELGVDFREVHLAMLAARSAASDTETAITNTTVAVKANMAQLGQASEFARGLGVAERVFGVDATRAADVVTIGVAVGAIENPEELIRAYGLAGDVVKSAGLDINEFTGLLGENTQVTGSATRSATGLRSLFVSLSRPTADAEERLDSLYGSVDNFRALMAKDTPSALEGLLEKLGGDTVAFGQIFSDVEGRTFGLNVARNADNYRVAIDRVTNSTGAFAAKIAEAEGTQLTAFNRQVQAVRADMDKMGSAGLSLIEIFGQLPEPVQTAGRILFAVFGIALVGQILGVGGAIASMTRLVFGLIRSLFTMQLASLKSFVGVRRQLRLLLLGLRGVADWFRARATAGMYRFGFAFRQHRIASLRMAWAFAADQSAPLGGSS